MNEHTTSEDTRWAALVRRDRQADGAFWYGVKTTGIYCRPACPARLPRRANVQFFDDPAAAEQAGFRPCKRCQPGDQAPPPLHNDLVARACAMLDTTEPPPSLAALATAAGFSPAHFHRLFRTTTGITPKQYARAAQLKRMRERLRQDESVSEAIANAGFGSSSRFYSDGTARLGMQASAYRAGASGVTMHYTVISCYLGQALVAASERGICAIELGDDAETLKVGLRARFPHAELVADDPAFAAQVAQVVSLLETPSRGLALPLDVQGTAFQQRVWAALRDIPAGSTVSYAELAARISSPQAIRAVAGACAANQLAVAIPCHRVIRSNGDLSGYRWGLARKRALLAREADGNRDEPQ